MEKVGSSLKKKEDHSILDAIFNLEKPAESSMMDALFGSGSSNRPAGQKRKRPWQSNREECPNSGSIFAAGGTCPGCSLHDEEMTWR